MSGTRIAAGMLAVALAGCSDLTNNDFDGLVEVVADIEPGGEGAVVTIRNERDKTILLRQGCGSRMGLEYRDGGEWQSLAMRCTTELLGPTSIGSGDELVHEEQLVPPGPYLTESGDAFLVGSPPRLPDGKYRFRAALMDTDENPLPDDIRASNTFQIEP